MQIHCGKIEWATPDRTTAIVSSADYTNIINYANAVLINFLTKLLF